MKIFMTEDWEGYQEFSVCTMSGKFFPALNGLLFLAHLLFFLLYYLPSGFHLSFIRYPLMPIKEYIIVLLKALILSFFIT